MYHLTPKSYELIIFLNSYILYLEEYFINKLFSLPSYTQAFILYLESRIDSIFIHTLALHLKFITRLNNLTPRRLPTLLARGPSGGKHSGSTAGGRWNRSTMSPFRESTFYQVGGRLTQRKY
jgi:hypothetical protein